MAFFAFAAFLDECQERALLTLSLFPKIHTESVHAKKEPSHSAPKPEYYFLAGPWDCFTVLKSSDHVESSDISFKM